MKGVEMRTLLESQANQFTLLNPDLVYRFKDGAGVLSSKLRLISGATLTVTSGTSDSFS
jgi:hypothetical protein